MRKLLLTVILLIVFMAFPVCAHAWEWSLDSDGTLEISGSGAVEDFNAASETPWYGQTVKKVVVAEGITQIGRYAFRNCTGLTEAILPDSLVKLGESAFEGCKALQKVTIGTGLRTVEAYAFLDCTKLSGVYITDVDSWCAVDFAAYSSSPMYYAKELYVNGQSVSGTVQLSPGVTKVPKYAFYGCEKITAVYLPDTVTAVGSDAFTYCSGLSYADLGGTREVGSAAFSYCTALEQVAMEHVTALKDYAFAYCSALSAVQLSDSLKQLGQRAFYECAALQEMHFSNSLESMGSYCFYGCIGLQAVTIPESMTVIPAYSFRGCTGLKTLSVPETVTTIEKYAFYGCSGLSALTIPRDLTTVGNYAFYNCTGLQEIHFNARALKDLTAGNYAFYKAGKTGLTVTVAAEVTRIQAYLFNPYSTYSPNIEQVIFEHGSVCTEIGKYAFASCKSLKELVFRGAAPTIGSNAFNKITATCYYPANWDSAILQSYGGTVTWKPLLAEAFDGTAFSSWETALLYSDRLRLLGDVQIDAALQQPLYLDMNGFDLSGVLTGGYDVYGIDGVTDGYEGENAGTFSCVDGAGQPIVPKTQCKVDTKRYLAVEGSEGYSFHRFYMGITHMTLRPGQQGVGFKAVFYGDQAVRAQIAATGYALELEGYSAKTQWKNGAYESGAVITMLVRNFDAERFGETPLSARLCIQLLDGTVIESGSCTMTLRGLMEQLNEMPSLLTQTQRTQLAQWIEKCPEIGKWNIDQL